MRVIILLKSRKIVRTFAKFQDAMFTLQCRAPENAIECHYIESLAAFMHNVKTLIKMAMTIAVVSKQILYAVFKKKKEQSILQNFLISFKVDGELIFRNK